MTAGLPKKMRLRLLFLLLVLLAGTAALGLEAVSEGATFEDLIAQIKDYPLPEDYQDALITAFAAAIDDVNFTIDDAVALLNRLGLEELDADADPEPLVDALLTVLGEIGGEGLSAEEALNLLDDLLAAPTIPEGISNAIGKAAATALLTTDEIDALLQQVEALILEGVPPGIVLRVTKEALRLGNEEDLAALLEALGTAILDEGRPPGQAANEVTGKGRYKNQEQGLNQNRNQGPNPEPEGEEERNRNGSHGHRQGHPNEDKKGQGKKG